MTLLSLRAISYIGSWFVSLMSADCRLFENLCTRRTLFKVNHTCGLILEKLGELLRVSSFTTVCLVTAG